MRVRLLSLCTVAGLVMLAAARAHADNWRTDVSMSQTPNDVLEVWGPERFSVGYPQGAHLFVDGGVLRSIEGTVPSIESAGTYYHPDQDCFISVDKVDGVPIGVRAADGGSCGSFAGNPIAATGNLIRVKHAADGGGAVAVAKNGTDHSFYLSESNLYESTGFNPLTAFLVNVNGTVGLVRVNGKLHVLIGTATSTANVYWVDGTNLSGATLLRQNSTDVGIVQAIDMFSAGNPARPYAVVGTQHGLLQGSTGSSPEPLAPIPQRLDGGVSSVSMNVGFGGNLGQGFGMAIVELPDGGREVLSPVPMIQDTKAGTVWQPRSLPAGVASAPLKQVACTGARYCVFTADKAGAGNLFIYSNDAGPEISVAAPGATVVDTGADLEVTLSESQTYPLTFSAPDPDGDPVLVTVAPVSVSTGWDTVVPAPGQRPGEPAVWNVTTAPTCETRELARFRVSAADGLASHESSEDVRVQVKHTKTPEVPSVVLSDGGSPGGGPMGELFAGGPSLTLRMAGDGRTAAGCTLHPRWEPLFTGTGVPSLEQDGGTVVITPPDRFCSQNANPVEFGFKLEVTDDGGLSNSKVFNVNLLPWGLPNAVFGQEPDLVLTAGGSVRFEPTQPVHARADGNAAFPGVSTEWQLKLSDGGVPDGGVTLRALDGGAPADAGGVWAEKVVLETSDCVDAELVVSARHQLSDGCPSPTLGPESRRLVRVQTALEPFADEAFLFALDGGPSPDVLRVEVESTLNCSGPRGLYADLWLEPVGGGERIATATVPIPGEWQPSLAVGCGRPLLVKGVMGEDAGSRTAEFVRRVETPRVETGLNALPEDSALVARCGEQARATLTQTFPPEACQTPDVTWTQETDGGSPPLEQAVLSGSEVELVTRDTGLDSLVGQSVMMRVTASAGPDNVASRWVELPITVDPFVRVRRRTEVPAASETGLVGVSVDLLNTTACGVHGVSYEERLEGLTYVEGSAKFNGESVEAVWKDRALTVTGLTLEGEGTGTLTYVARPHLVGERRMEGTAWLRNAVISLSENPGPQVPDSGCGCSGSGPGPMLFALGALVAAVRRRRHRP